MVLQRVENAIVVAFGKPKSQLNEEEMRVFRRAVRAASYYRRWETNKHMQRIQKRDWKQDTIKALGIPAACQRCGYDKCIAALDFHHINPAEKDAPPRSLKEALKCQLICANCHREEHYKNREKMISRGRPRRELDPRVAAYLQAVGVTRPVEWVEDWIGDVETIG